MKEHAAATGEDVVDFKSAIGLVNQLNSKVSNLLKILNNAKLSSSIEKHKL